MVFGGMVLDHSMELVPVLAVQRATKCYTQKRKMIMGLPQNAVWRHFEGTGTPAHFYHANGFPSGAYEPLLEKLAGRFRLSALDMRPIWPGIGEPPKRRDWQIYADDLIAFIEAEYDEPIVGIGHSLGATCTVFAAEKRPDLFKALVLIEPAMLPAAAGVIVKFLPKAMALRQIPAAKGAIAKPDIWPSRAAFLEACRAQRGYKRFDDKAFEAFAANGVRERKDGTFELVFPKTWEAHNYTQPPAAMKNLARITHPCVGIVGKPSVFFTKKMLAEWQARAPKTVIKIDTNYGHLIPIEAPDNCFKLIEAGLAEIL